MRPLLAPFVLALALPSLAVAADSCDLLITGGRIVDGTGAPWFLGDVCVLEGRIDALQAPGKLAGRSAKRTIDATGLVALEGTLADLVRTDHKVILAGPLPKPRRVFDRAELSEAYLADDLAAAMELARKLASLGPDEPAPPSRRSIATPVAAVTKGAPRTKDGG